MRINGNTVFIPGATSGIGLALAVALHERGNEVIVGGRRTELLDRVTAEHPGIHAYRIDTSDAEDVAEVAKRVIAEHPEVNVLVPMAGIMRVEDWTDPAGFLGTAEQTVTTNVLGPIRLIAAFVEHLQTRPDATILTVSSGLAFAPLQVTPTYNASKAFIHMLSESIRLQLAGTGVRVVELEPPSVQTDLMPGHRENADAMPLDEFVAEVVDLLETQPDATEIQVERVKFLRYGERLPVRVDLVVETVGAATWSHSVRSVRPGGTIVVAGATTGDPAAMEIQRLFFLEIAVLGATMGSRQDLEQLLAFLARTGVRPVVDSTVPLARVGEGLARLARGEQFGKVVAEV